MRLNVGPIEDTGTQSECLQSIGERHRCKRAIDVGNVPIFLAVERIPGAEDDDDHWNVVLESDRSSGKRRHRFDNFRIVIDQKAVWLPIAGTR